MLMLLLCASISAPLSTDYELDPSVSVVEWRIDPDTWSVHYHGERFPENHGQHRRRRGASDENPLNISVEYDLSAAASSLHATITKEATDAVDILCDLLPGRRSSEFTGRSLDVDFQIRQFESASTLGMAGPTHYMLTTDGYAYVTRGLIYISALYVESLILSKNYKSVVAHELMHLLGFPAMWQFYPDSVTVTEDYFAASAAFANAVAHEFPSNAFVHAGKSLSEYNLCIYTRVHNNFFF